MRPQLERLWQGRGRVFGVSSIRLDWSNDRHHEVTIRGGGNVDDVAEALLLMASIIKNDRNLQEDK